MTRGCQLAGRRRDCLPETDAAASSETPEEFIARAPWCVARTMPDQPHQYTVRGQTSDEHFDLFVSCIRERGYRASYRGRHYIYLEVDGWKYWPMGASARATTIINRAWI